MEIIFDNVSLNLTNKNIFSSLNVKFVQNTITIIKGANGSGKSTLLKLAAHLTLPTSGKVYISEKNLSPHGRDYQKNIAMLTPEMKLYENLTAEENFKFFAGLRETTLNSEGILSLWERVGLKEEEIKNKFSSNLSTGMNQRVKFAIFLAINAPIWLLDEPTANLDDIGRETVIKETKTAAENGKIVLWATNDEREFDIAHKIIDLSKTEDLS